MMSDLLRLTGLFVLGLFILGKPSIAGPIRVLDPQGTPISGATVKILEAFDKGTPLKSMFPTLAEGLTDAKGVSTVRLPLRVGKFLLLIEHPEYLPLARQISLETAGSPWALAAGRAWQGRIEALPGGIQEGRICASWSEDVAGWGRRPWRRCGSVSSQAEFNLKGLPPGDVTVEIEVPGYLLWRQTLAPGASKPLRLQPGMLVTGRVTGPAPETPVSGASIRSEGSASVNSKDDGHFALAVRSFPAVLEIAAQGFRSQIVKLEKPPGKAGLAILLAAGEQLRGALHDEDGKPVTQARFWIEEQKTAGFRSENREISTAEGKFLLDLPGPGTFRIRIRAEGFRDEVLPAVTIAPGESYLLGPVALRRGSSVTGAVIDALSGEPLERVEIELIPEGAGLLGDIMHRQIYRTVSDERGRFSVSGMRSGLFNLTLRRSGYALTTRQVSLEGEQTEDLGQLPLGRGTLLQGVVRDREGRPRSGHTVRLLGRENGSLLPIAELTTGAEGEFKGPALEAGRYRLQVRGSRLLLDQEIEVPEAEDGWSVDLIAGGTRLEGSVTRAGQPVSGGSVVLSSALEPAQRRGKVFLSAPGAEAYSHGLSETRLTAEVRSDGSFELLDAPAGTINILYTEGSESITRSLLVPDAAHARLAVEIGGIEIQGQVVADGSGAGLKAIVQIVAPEVGLVANQPTEEQGFFTVSNLQPGRYSMQVSAEGFETKYINDFEVREGGDALQIALEPGQSGGLLLRLRYPDGSPASWVPVTLLDASGMLVRALPTNGGGELTLDEIPQGSYWIVWSDAFGGAGASEPVRIAGRDLHRFEHVLSEGGALQLVCILEGCAGKGIDFVSIITASGADVGPHVSGVSPALRFSADGRASLGRLSPGNYVVRLWSQGSHWTKAFRMERGGADVQLP